MKITKKIIARFTEKWAQDKSSGCWIWTASTAGKGYGQMKIPGTRRQMYAHRLAWIIKFGPIRPGRMVCHSCDTPRCVNPSHMFLGSKADNARDMASKRRHLFGERNAQAKLTDDDVRKIHEASARGETQRSIAEQFGVGQMTVSRIIRGERWAHIYRQLKRLRK